MSEQGHLEGGRVLLTENFLSPKPLTKLKFFLLQICISQQISHWGVPQDPSKSKTGGGAQDKNFLSLKPGGGCPSRQKFLKSETRGGGVPSRPKLF